MITSRLLAHAQRRAPDFIVLRADGTPYLHRWWLLPRNRVLNVYLHQFIGSDDERALHDHPWSSLSCILSGSYIEVLPANQLQPGVLDFVPFGLRRRAYRAGDWIARRAEHRHRLEIETGSECWTLFITGPTIRNWGFWCARGWLPWQQFLNAGNAGKTETGCGA